MVQERAFCVSRTEWAEQRRNHWESIARNSGRRTGGLYHRRLEAIYRGLVRPGERVLELGCGEGQLLAALEPSYGVGIDFSPTRILCAKERFPHLEFRVGDVENHDWVGPFDVVILSDLVNELWDVQGLLERLRSLCHPGTRIIFNYYSRLWELPLGIARKMGLATPLPSQNWLTPLDLKGMLHLSGLETVRSWNEILCPLPVPLLEGMANRFLVKLWPICHLGLTNFLVARPNLAPVQPYPRVSVLVPARNEAGNIPEILERVPQMASGTELIFVEGHSSDGTFEAIEKELQERPGLDAKLLKQPGVGKGDAVRAGFAVASGEILMILDADLTVAPEDLPRFVDALISGKAEFVNGVRLVYPMEKEAMRFFNLLGNKFFSLAFSAVLGQSLKDTLCGTKVLWKKDYERIAANRAFFGDFDPFGDFDLLFGASRLNLKIVDLPVRYASRSYGTTNIQRWRHGWLLLRMLLFAARRLKFV